jgi:hypothetical protein
MALKWIASVVLTGIVGLVPPAAVFAQGQPETPVQPNAAAIDVNKLPINLQRISRDIRTTTVREQRNGLNLRYLIQVIAQTPPLVLFTPDDNLAFGPAPHGAPSHSEMIEQNTPKEYRAPAADLSALQRWLIEKGK